MQKSKYHSRSAKLGHLKFASAKERDYYLSLLQRKDAGEITKIELQPTYVLQEGFRYKGKAIREIKYTPDFRITYADGHQQVIEVKGYRTPDYVIRMKLFLYKYDVDFLEV